MSSRSAQAAPQAPALKKIRPVLVTGGAGFIGCNLVDRLASEQTHVVVLDSLGRPGVEVNAVRLRARHPSRVTLAIGDIRDDLAADFVRDCSGIFHLAAQVAVTSSLKDPAGDCDVNLRGTLALLEAARRSRERPPFVFASTNKVYGNLADIELEPTDRAYLPVHPGIRRFGINEQQPLMFSTPYGCSKGAADQYVLDYAKTFGLRATVLRMSCVYGPRQLGTEDQGWVAHFLINALKGEPITIFGDGRQVRDILYVDDAVEAYVRAMRSIDRLSGRPFNLGGGPENAVSLLDVLERIREIVDRMPEIRFADWRPGDQRYYVSDTRRVTALLELPRPRTHAEGIALLANWLAKSRKAPARRVPTPSRARAQVPL